VKDCQYAENQQFCLNEGFKCVGSGWFSKISHGRVDAREICVNEGYSGTVDEYGGNWGVLCKYGNDLSGGSPDSLGSWVSWKCKLEHQWESNVICKPTVSNHELNRFKYVNDSEATLKECADRCKKNKNCFYADIGYWMPRNKNTIFTCILFGKNCVSTTYTGNQRLKWRHFAKVPGCQCFDERIAVYTKKDGCICEDNQAQLYYADEIMIEESDTWERANLTG
jgi:hypothetical protein